MTCLIPVILCGGAGSRLWPVSRELHPKPFIELADGQSLLQKAFLRGAAMPSVTEIITVTNRELLFQTEEQFRSVNKAGLATTFILEPFGRNTAPALAAAALLAAKNHGREAILLALPADHVITQQPAFAEAVAQAVRLASGGKLVTFGIEPLTPETGYGYIEAEGTKVIRFVEKPSSSEAEAYLASGRYLWNSGMVCFAAGVMLDEMEKYCPEVLHATSACIATSRLANGKGFAELSLDGDSFSKVPNISIDYAVMEKSAEVAVVPCNIGWNDIGSWNALGDLTPPDSRGNRVLGNAMLQDTDNCYIYGSERVIGAVGIENLIIVDTADALLVASRDHAQQVKHIYARLKTEDNEAYKLHRTVYRPWGTYTILNEGPGFKVKRIEVKSGASLSLQMHHHRSEHWVVISGVAQVINGENEFLIHANESTYIPSGNKHRLTNPGDATLVMIEVQNGNYLGEDDIVRFDDSYGRMTERK